MVTTLCVCHVPTIHIPTPPLNTYARFVLQVRSRLQRISLGVSRVPLASIPAMALISSAQFAQETSHLCMQEQMNAPFANREFLALIAPVCAQHVRMVASVLKADLATVPVSARLSFRVQLVSRVLPIALVLLVQSSVLHRLLALVVVIALYPRVPVGALRAGRDRRAT
jgi:hypothetical protein